MERRARLGRRRPKDLQVAPSMIKPYWVHIGKLHHRIDGTHRLCPISGLREPVLVSIWGLKFFWGLKFSSEVSKHWSVEAVWIEGHPQDFRVWDGGR